MSDLSYQNARQDWGVDELVIKLRHLRVQSLETLSLIHISQGIVR